MIQICGEFVAQDNFRFMNNGASDCYALLLTAAQFGRAI